VAAVQACLRAWSVNGKIGQLKNILIGLPGDPSGKDEPEMPVPANLNYDIWLGSTPLVY